MMIAMSVETVTYRSGPESDVEEVVLAPLFHQAPLQGESTRLLWLLQEQMRC